MVSSSFARGQGASAVHDRLRYEASREEIIAEGFADLMMLAFMATFVNEELTFRRF